MKKCTDRAGKEGGKEKREGRREKRAEGRAGGREGEGVVVLVFHFSEGPSEVFAVVGVHQQQEGG